MENHKINPESEYFDSILEEVKASGDVLTLDMSKLKAAVGAGRLGKWVRDRIVGELQQRGLIVVGELPDSQAGTVRVYRQATTVGNLIKAVLTPGFREDETIRSATGGEAEKVLDQVRRLVCP